MSDIDSLVTIPGARVLLRDPRGEDLYARVRWSTVDTAWQDWDAPWEGRTLLLPEEAMRIDLTSTRITWPLPAPRSTLWIQALGGPLLGWLNSYHHDPEQRAIWIGIDICESSYWGRGLGTEAFGLWRDYQFVQRDLATVRTATWSGNTRMMRVAEKCGFPITDRKPGVRLWRGVRYDSLDFTCTREAWQGREGGR